jgi:hypothetical protein
MTATLPDIYSVNCVGDDRWLMIAPSDVMTVGLSAETLTALFGRITVSGMGQKRNSFSNLH